MNTKVLDKMNNEVLELDKEKRKAYMREYMNKKYKDNPLYSKKYRRTTAWMKKYNIDKSIYDKYKEDTHHVYEIKRLIKELNEGTFECFLMEYKSLFES